MAATADRLTLADFELQYGDAKPHYEFWFGEAVQKAMPTGIHGLLQVIIAFLLRNAGYKTATEVKLKISTDFQPVPDIVATLGRFERAYFDNPVDVAVEILSPADTFQRVVRKCQIYAEWGIPIVVMLDPEDRQAWVWDKEAQSPIKTDTIALKNGAKIEVSRIFAELDSLLE
jgi:Uma2 family endonuclease